MSFDDNIKYVHVRNAFDSSFKLFINQIHLLNPEYDYLEVDEKKILDSKLIEASIIIFGIIKLVIEEDEFLKEQYSDVFGQFMGVKLDELSKREEYSDFFNSKDEEDEFYLYSELFSRVRLYKNEINNFVKSKIWTPPKGVYHYFFLKPGDFSNHNEYTNLEEEVVTYHINDKNSNVIDDFIFPHAIKDTYSFIINQFHYIF